MNNQRKRQMRLADVIRIVSQYSRNDHELGLVVADLINRGRIKIHGRLEQHRILVS